MISSLRSKMSMLHQRLRLLLPGDRGNKSAQTVTVLDWLNTGPTFGDERRFLQRHLELLTAKTDETLELLIDQYQAERETLDDLCDRRLIVRDIHRRLAPRNPTTAAHVEVVAAIADAYTNLYSGFVLDMPRWLRSVIRTSETLDRHPLSPIVSERQVALWRSAYRRAKRQRLAEPILAEICGRLHAALSEDVDKTRQTSLEEARRLLEEALTYLPRVRFPYLWATTQLALGMIYRDLQDANVATNVERAIDCYEAALEIFTEDDYPYDRASTLNNLANAYVARPTTLREANVELAIISLRRALRIFTLETYPDQWAMAHHNLANAYKERRRGDRARNLEEAIACFNAALTQRTEQRAERDWAESLHDLGGVYVLRIRGDRAANLRQALACYESTLRVFTRERSPANWAGAMHNLGVILAEVATISDSALHNEEFDTYFGRALEVYQPDNYPADYRGCSLMRAEAHAQHGKWSLAHEAYAQALRVEDTLMILTDSVQAQDAVLASGRDGSLCDAYALARLGRYEEAVLTIERGRARGLAAARAFDTADPTRIQDPRRRADYLSCRGAWRDALRRVQQPPDRRLSSNEQRRAALNAAQSLADARTAFDATVVAIREANDPADFLRNDLTGAQVRTTLEQQLPPGHAVVYLIATAWGGVAVAAIGATQALPTRFEALMLPRLTTKVVANLIARDNENHVRRTPGGFAYAQENSGFKFIIQDWPGISQAARVDALEDEWYGASIERLGEIEDDLLQARMSGTLATSYGQLNAQSAANSSEATLRAAVERVLAIPTLAALATVPFDSYSKTQRRVIENTLMYHMLRAELEYCGETLTDVAMLPLMEWLDALRVSSLTLIPCGYLTTFPLLGWLQGIESSNVGDHLTATVAPSIRSLTSSRSRHVEHRNGIYALGNPLPTPQPLRWGQAEALCLAELAGDRTHAAIQFNATREWALQKLQVAEVFSAACHGAVDQTYLRSRLILANRAAITLADALNGDITDLRGLRLLILSACQTSVPDVRGSRDEVRSLAAGWLQAGAQAVLAALWPVDDRATFLLMLRFAQIWFPQMASLHPARALAQAQQWLRELTYADLRVWGRQPALQRAFSRGADFGSRGNPFELDPFDDIPVLPSDAPHSAIRGYGDYPLAPEEWWTDGVDEADRPEPRSETSGIVSPAIEIHEFATYASRDGARPYAHPYFWASFQLTGW